MNTTVAQAAPLLTRPFALAWVAYFFHALSFQLHLHVPGYLHGRGATEFDIGLSYAVSAASAIAAKPLCGRRIDGAGPRPVLLVGGVLAVTSTCGYLLLQGRGLLWFYPLRMLQTIAIQVLVTSFYAYAAAHLPEPRRIQGMALFGVAGILPIGLAGLLGEALLRVRADYVLLFATSAAFAILACAISSALTDAGPAGDGPPRHFSAAMLQRELLPLWFASLLCAIIAAIYFTFLKTFVQSSGIGSVAVFFSMYTTMSILIRVLGGRLPERAGPKRVLFVGMVSMATGLLLLGQASSGYGLAAAGIACGVGQGYALPVLLGLVVTRADPRARGSALAIFTSFYDIGTIVAGPLFGFVVRATNYAVMFHTAAAVLLIGMGIFARLDRRH
ncbi:MFS transporter [Pendulispora brunnea]|uniref:MFS transporter n=1 Tax=Pendulispora brunnea TaxID=2905690 RepID=A0ABZ2K1H4_9BACT